jgi:cytochrome b6-f complex iron-sulfur subunit
MKRRRFLQILLAFLGTITLASFFYSLFKFLAALPARARESGKLAIRKTDIPTNESRNFVLNNVPIVVINHAEKGYIVLSRVCTHLGCLVEYSRAKQQLLCPCHAGTYDLDGSTVSGPPPKPLPTIPFKIDGESIILG